MNTHVLNLRNNSAPDMCGHNRCVLPKETNGKSSVDKNVQQKCIEISQDYFYPSQ